MEMRDLLIKLGSQAPELKEHIRPVVSHIDKEAANKMSQTFELDGTEAVLSVDCIGKVREVMEAFDAVPDLYEVSIGPSYPATFKLYCRSVAGSPVEIHHEDDVTDALENALEWKGLSVTLNSTDIVIDFPLT